MSNIIVKLGLNMFDMHHDKVRINLLQYFPNIHQGTLSNIG